MSVVLVISIMLSSSTNVMASSNKTPNNLQNKAISNGMTTPVETFGEAEENDELKHLLFAKLVYDYLDGYEGKKVIDYINDNPDLYDSKIWEGQGVTYQNLYNTTIGEWEIYKIYNNNSKTGFYAVAFKKDNKVVIAFRGSEMFTEEFALDESNDWTGTDFKFALFNELSAQFEDADYFYKTVLFKLGREGYKENRVDITLTGHSLGGALCAYESLISGKYGYCFDGACGHIIDLTYYYGYLDIDNFTGTDDLDNIITNGYRWLLDASDKDAMLEYVQKSGGKIIANKGATFYAVSAAVCKLCSLLLASTDSYTTVSTMMHGEYGIDDVCLSTLCLVGPNGYQGKVVCFNGSNNDDDSKSIYRKWLSLYVGSKRISGRTIIDRKQALVDYFRTDAEIMIATESGAEGINLQFCSLLVNYDMPWNPQRIEQRIGRCHRYGQKFDVVVVNFVNQLNYADCRVYELLNDKFNLFEGVFGSSDEVLGSLESGVDFEKKLNHIYQTCRTEREIEAAFNQLQSELEEIIQQRIKDTKKSLLENFDEEVVDKLKIRQSEDRDRVNSYNRHFWRLAKSVLKDSITEIDNENLTFVLPESINNNIPSGTYILNKDHGDFHQLRVTHPLGEYIISRALETPVPDASIEFEVDNLSSRQVLLEKYKGKSGVAVVYKVKAYNELDSHEHLLFCSKTDDGENLSPDFLKKLFEANAINESTWSGDNVEELLTELYEQQLYDLKHDVYSKSEEYVSFEIDKYQAWAEDQVYSLENEVIALRKEDEALKKQIRKERNAKLKLELQENEAKIAKQLRQKQRQLFDMEDECADKVDAMTVKLRVAMTNHYDTSTFMRFRWHIK